MVDAAAVGDHLVVDVGAGTGALTDPLLRAGARVVAVELDPGRAARLRERFADEPVTVVRADLETLRWPGRPELPGGNTAWIAGGSAELGGAHFFTPHASLGAVYF